MVRVLKFGGSCLKTTDSLRKVARLVVEGYKNPVVVVSAVSGITNLLEKCIQVENISEVEIKAAITDIRKIHHELLQPLKKDIKAEAFEEIDKKLTKLDRILLGILYTGEVSPSLRAVVLSFGERLSTIVIKAYLKASGREARVFESEQAGIVTDASFESATVNLEITARRLKGKILPLIKKGLIPVITGFYGISEDGKTTLFGRNGSDYSAAVVAHGLNAEALELWKDVDGFMSADPGVVKEARKIKRLSYYEAAELSYFGARIIHPRTFEPLLRKNIPVYVKNLHHPEKEGTIIFPSPEESETVVKSVAFNRDISIIGIYGPGVGYKPGVIARVGKLLCEFGININSIITSQTCINLLLEKRFAEKGYRLLLEATADPIEMVRLKKDVALVAIVGEGLHRRKGLAARAFHAVASAGINIEMLSTGAPERAYYFIVKRNEVERAVKSIHKEFFE